MSRIKAVEFKKESKQSRKEKELTYFTNNEYKPRDSNEKKQILDLLHKLPKLHKIFQVHKKIGEGTFSSVYLASLHQHADLSNKDKKWFAIKHLVPTSHPSRIEHELRCLQEIGGRNNVIGVELCLRHLDTVVFVMPYIPHTKFSEYVGDMDARELQRYMRALLSALAHVHSFGVIHRDVKPSNFLYDRQNQRYLLVDFGLAQRICPEPEEETAQHPNGSRKRGRDYEVGEPAAKRRVRGDFSQVEPDQCACAGVGGVCGACGARGAARAPRAGTAGYRPPEVLLKVGGQCGRVDVWAAGAVLGGALGAAHPLLGGAPDLPALAHLHHLLGSAALHRAAAALGRRIVTSKTCPGLCLRKLCARLRSRRGGATVGGVSRGGAAVGPACKDCRLPKPECICLDPNIDPREVRVGEEVCGFPDSAFALCAHLLQPLPADRPSARQALLHPFLNTPLP